MTVGKLKMMLENYDDDMEIIIKSSNSMYGENISGIEEGMGVAAFHDINYRALVLTSGEQCGVVCNEDDLDLEEE